MSSTNQLPPCKVCGHPGTGFHYGVTTCVACKGFFRRSLHRSTPYVCPNQGKCSVEQNGKRRANCSKCRLDRCIAVGMSKSAIKTGRYSSEKKSKDVLEILQLQASSTGDPSRNRNSATSDEQADLPNPSTSDNLGKSQSNRSTKSSNKTAFDKPGGQSRLSTSAAENSQAEVRSDSDGSPDHRPSCSGQPKNKADGSPRSQVHPGVDQSPTQKNLEGLPQPCMSFFKVPETLKTALRRKVESKRSLEFLETRINQLNSDMTRIIGDESEGSAMSRSDDHVVPSKIRRTPDTSVFTALKDLYNKCKSLSADADDVGSISDLSSEPGTDGLGHDSAESDHGDDLTSLIPEAMKMVSQGPDYVPQYSNNVQHQQQSDLVASCITGTPSETPSPSNPDCTSQDQWSSGELTDQWSSSEMNECTPNQTPQGLEDQLERTHLDVSEFTVPNLGSPFASPLTPSTSAAVMKIFQDFSKNAASSPEPQGQNNQSRRSGTRPPGQNWSNQSTSVETSQLYDVNTAEQPGKSIQNDCEPRGLNCANDETHNFIDDISEDADVPSLGFSSQCQVLDYAITLHTQKQDTTSECPGSTVKFPTDRQLHTPSPNAHNAATQESATTSADKQTPAQNCLLGMDSQSKASPDSVTSPCDNAVDFVVEPVTGLRIPKLLEGYDSASYEMVLLRPVLDRVFPPRPKTTGGAPETPDTSMSTANTNSATCNSAPSSSSPNTSRHTHSLKCQASSQNPNSHNGEKAVGAEDVSAAFHTLPRTSSQTTLPWCEFTVEELDQLIVQLSEADARYGLDDLNSQSDEEIARKQIKYQALCKLKEEMFGKQKLLKHEKYAEIFQQTGVDIDGRKQFLERMLPLYEESLRSFVQFFKRVPGFRGLCMEDKMRLSKGCLTELWLLCNFRGYSHNLGVWVCFLNMASNVREVMGLCMNYDALWDAKINAARALQRLELSLNQVLLLKAIALTTYDREVVKEPAKVGMLNWKYHCCLLLSMTRTHSDPFGEYARIVDCLTELRAVFETSKTCRQKVMETWMLLLGDIEYVPLWVEMVLNCVE